MIEHHEHRYGTPIPLAEAVPYLAQWRRGELNGTPGRPVIREPVDLIREPLDVLAQLFPDQMERDPTGTLAAFTKRALDASVGLTPAVRFLHGDRGCRGDLRGSGTDGCRSARSALHSTETGVPTGIS